jgi:replication factor C subunit 3/5
MAGMDIEEELPWVEKYRPQCLEDLVSQGSIVSTIRRFVAERKMPHLLFYGPPGTGKTSTIQAVAREMYPTSRSAMTLELNASDDRGIQVVREQIKTFASTQQIQSKGIKLVILDEADSMTSAAQFALRRIIEKYTRTTRFCLICNYVNKVIPALQSRCTRFRFLPLKYEDSALRLDQIAAAEGVRLTQDGLAAILKLAQGDMRKCVNLLQSTSMACGTVDGPTVYSASGNPPPEVIDKIMEFLLSTSFNEAFESITQMKKALGLAMTDILREIHKKLMEIEFPERMKIFIVERLAETEVRLALGANEKLQLGAVVGVFVESRNLPL